MIDLNNKNNFNKYVTLIRTADDFFEAALRCDLNESIKVKKYPLMIPNFVNSAFACELYLKATLFLNKNEIPQKHKLDDLFLELDQEDKKGIYDIWRTIEEQNIPDCEYAQDMFFDNLKAISNVFVRFRYVHEWAENSISLEYSFTIEQFEYFYSRPFGSPEVYEGFLDQLAKSIRKYNDNVILPIIGYSIHLI